MTEFGVHDAQSARLARALARMLASQRRRLVDRVRERPAYPGSDFWSETFDDMRAELNRALAGTFLMSAAQFADEIGLGVGAAPNEAAAAWAASTAVQMSALIDKNTQRIVQTALPRFFLNTTTLAELRAELLPAFGPERAYIIATTETTRAAVQGERAQAAALEAEGVRFRRYWLTRLDEIVCPVCGPLHNQQHQALGYVADGVRYDAPPAHTRCRCAERHEVIT